MSPRSKPSSRIGDTTMLKPLWNSSQSDCNPMYVVLPVMGLAHVNREGRGKTGPISSRITWILVVRLYTVIQTPSLLLLSASLTRVLEFSVKTRTASCAMKAATIFLSLALFSLVSAKKSGDVTELQIGVKHKPESCEIQAHKGDRIKVHYRGQLTDGSVFDSSFERGDPIEFELGSGQVIKGWDQGLLGMCVGEKRKLKIPSKLGYGAQGSPPKIPGGATLIFDTELVAVNGKPSSGEKSEL